MIEKIQRLPVRSIWKYEDRDFTTWLTDNIDVLTEAVGEEYLMQKESNLQAILV